VSVAESEEVDRGRRGGRAKGPKLMNGDSGSAGTRSQGFWDALIPFGFRFSDAMETRCVLANANPLPRTPDPCFQTRLRRGSQPGI
jgi:hypothetical protein